MIENVQALQALGITQDVTANNVANMNTDGFRPSRVDLETGPEGRGVRVQDIVEISPGGQLAATGNAQTETVQEPEPPSETDLATEMVQMIQTENAFAANVAVLRTDAEMAGTLIDTMV